MDILPTLYIANKNYSSWSLRPWLLMRQLQIPFTEKLMPFNADGFRHFSPTGKVPCLQMGETLVWDSLAIMEYLAESYPQVWPADAKARAWARSAAAEMHAGFARLRDDFTMNCGLRVRPHAPTPALARELERVDELWSQGLSQFGGPFLAGAAFCAVDAFYAPLAFRFQTYAPVLSAGAQAYADRLLALPAMQAWYAAALSETWRDEAHEAEARQAGEWISDLRAVQA